MRYNSHKHHTLPMLTGPELLDFVKSNADMAKDELMKRAGYSYQTEDGKTRYKQNDFMNALLTSQGIVLVPPKTSSGGGRQLSYKTKCMTNGNVTIGKAYFSKANAKTGDAYDIVVGEKQIILRPIK